MINQMLKFSVLERKIAPRDNISDSFSLRARLHENKVDQ